MESQKLLRKPYLLALILMLLPVFGTAQAEEYIIGPEDLLDISFWQDPGLNTAVRVGLDGMISLDIVGQIQAGGKTTEQLQSEIVRLIYRLNKNISQATVRVHEFNYNYVFVIGQVNEPGKKSFEQIPDLWTLINESGGLNESGDLSRVTIIRGGDDAGKVEVVNVRSALAEGRIDRLPKIRRGDTIEVGRTPGQVLAGELGRLTDKKSLFYIVGAVTAPGAISYEDNIDIMEALAMAGGPTSDADLRKVQLLIKDDNFAQSVRLNLEAYSQTGRPARYILQKEDMVVVPPRRPGFLGSTVGQIATLVTALSTTYLLVDQIRNN
jgi:polysaccharide export outer membrane protein